MDQQQPRLPTSSKDVGQEKRREKPTEADPVHFAKKANPWVGTWQGEEGGIRRSPSCPVEHRPDPCRASSASTMSRRPPIASTPRSHSIVPRVVEVAKLREPEVARSTNIRLTTMVRKM